MTMRGHGLQDRHWSAGPLTRRDRLLWLWFLVYAAALATLAHRVGGAIGRWPGLAATLGILVVGMAVWRRSLVERVRRIFTLLGYGLLMAAYWTLFTPWAWLIGRRDPLQLRSAAVSRWQTRRETDATTTDAARQY